MGKRLTAEDVGRLRLMGTPGGAFGNDLELMEQVCSELLERMRQPERWANGLLKEAPLGICPACGNTVFESLEAPERPVWTDVVQLQEGNPMRKLRVVDVTQDPSADDRVDDVPIHYACYNNSQGSGGSTW